MSETIVRVVRCPSCNKVLFHISPESQAVVFKKCERCRGTSAISCEAHKEPQVLRFTPHNVMAQTAARV